uniref:Uncharacterized protein n=1 Tax=Romanomermis culicivorax TaxID=13658 RepID=A0A915IFU3_ROMCU
MPNSAVGKENDLNATHLAQAIYNYHKLIDHCCQAEGSSVKETLPTEEHEGQFLKDLIQRINMDQKFVKKGLKSTVHLCYML